MYERALNAVLRRRLADEPRRRIQVVLGPRQVGKTTSIDLVTRSIRMPVVSGSADTPGLATGEWLTERWLAARQVLATQGGPVVLFLDEVQKVADWPAWVKRYWDEDSAEGRDVRVVLAGSSPLLMQAGLSESLAGRFEVVHATHWTWPECRDAFGWDLDTFVYHGGYPGSADLVGDAERWRAYIVDSIVEPTVSRDILLMTRIDKPALLRRVFALACEHSGQELTYEKMVGQLQDAGNTTTVAHYLDLLGATGLVSGLQKYSVEAVRRRRSSPKLAVHDTALMSAMSRRSFAEARADSAWWGRLTEACVGAHLIASAQGQAGQVGYWRDRVGGRVLEVDYVIERDRRVTAVEVKSAEGGSREGLATFVARHPGAAGFLVGPGGIPLEEFLESEVVPFG